MSRDQIFKAGHVALITGAALGIGRSLAMRLAEAGMAVVMADLEGPDFDNAIEAVRKVAGGKPETVLGIATDVSDPEQVEKLRAATLEDFGTVHFVANNAVTRIGRGFNADLSEWRRAIDVNLWGPILGTRAFLPSLLSNDAPGAIVNVGSKQGITNPPGHPIYNVSKSALKTYTEALQHELRIKPYNQGDRRVTAHLLVPGWTTTGKAEHKPGAWRPEQVVDRMLTGVTENRFYIICPDDEVSEDMDRKRILWAAQDITENRPPLSRWHPDFAELAKKAYS